MKAGIHRRLPGIRSRLEVYTPLDVNPVETPADSSIPGHFDSELSLLIYCILALNIRLLKVKPVRLAVSGWTTIFEIGENRHAIGIDDHTTTTAGCFVSYNVAAFGGFPRFEIVFPHNSLDRASE